jgi:hypothetical protein
MSLKQLIYRYPCAVFFPPLGFMFYPLLEKSRIARTYFTVSFSLYLYTFISCILLYYIYYLAPYFMEGSLRIIFTVNWVAIVLLNIYFAAMTYLHRYEITSIPILDYIHKRFSHLWLE